MTRPRCGPTIGSREVHPSRSGSNEPSSRGGGGAVGGRSGRSTRPSGRVSSSAAMAPSPARASRSRSPAQRARSRSSAGAVAAEIPPGELRECLVPVDGRRLPEPVACEDVCVRATDHRPADDEAAEGREHEQVHQGLAMRGHVSPGDALAEQLARQRALVRERPLDRANAALGLGRRHTLLTEAARVPGEEGRRRQRVQPRVVLAADEMERAAIQPRDQKGALLGQGSIDVGSGEAGRPRADREARAPRILGLDREQPPGDRERVARRRA